MTNTALGCNHQSICIMYVCMYVFNIYLVSAPLRGFSGALKGCSQSVPNNSYCLYQTNTFWSVASKCYCSQLFERVWLPADCPVTGSAALIPNVLPRRDEGSVGSIIVYWPPLRIPNPGGQILIISGDHYTTTAHKILLAAHASTGCDTFSVFACIGNATGTQKTQIVFRCVEY